MRGRPDKVDEKDFVYAPIDADSDFDPLHNKQVIEEVIKWTDQMEERKEKEYLEEGAGERIAAVSQYIQNIKQGGGKQTPEGYFGRRYLAYLRGKEIMQKLKQQMGIKAKFGQEFVIQNHAKKS